MQPRPDIEVARQRRGPAATGEVLNRGGDFAVCLGRSFTVGPETVWAWLTEADRMRIWLGETRPSDGKDGPHLFHLAGDAGDAPLLHYDVERVEPISRVTVSMRESLAAPGDEADSERRAAPVVVATGHAWRLDLRLTATEIGTHLLLEQTISDRVPAPSVAAACEFYLDRLVRACHGRALTDLDYDDYFLSQGAAYRRMFPLPRHEALDASSPAPDTPR